MRDLERNKVKVTWVEYLGEQDYIDPATGLNTGVQVPAYTRPKTTKMRVSPNKGVAGEMPFGVNVDYERAMITTDMNCPISETSLLFIGKEYEVDVSGRPKHNYTVSAVAPDINQIAFAIKRVVGS